MAKPEMKPEAAVKQSVQPNPQEKRVAALKLGPGVVGCPKCGWRVTKQPVKTGIALGIDALPPGFFVGHKCEAPEVAAWERRLFPPQAAGARPFLALRYTADGYSFELVACPEAELKGDVLATGLSLDEVTAKLSQALVERLPFQPKGD